MPRGTLYHHLHKAETPLNWVQRLKIAIGAGRGLDYLHTGVGTQHGVIHRDVKSSNILLNENWDAMISDFGLSKIGPTNQSSSYVDASVKGTFGYLDPEYFYTRKLTRKTDVYAFGVVLFELLSGRLAVDERNSEDQCSLVRWAQKCVKERKLDQMVDPNIKGTIFPKCLKRFAQIAYRCLLSVLKERPTIAEAVVSLQALLELQQRHENSAEPSGITGFTWKIHKYLVLATKQNSDQSGTSSSKSHINMNRGSSTNKDGNNQGKMHRQPWESLVTDLKCFTYYDLMRATENLGDDKRYLKVYKGWIDKTTYSPTEDNTGLAIAVKRIDFYTTARWLHLKEFKHPNLEKLIGYCFEDQLRKQLFLVYEFMPNGNFNNLLNSGVVSRLPLVIKVKIAVGIARGLVFLHKTQYQFNVFEYRLDRHMILLDQDFTAKLSGYDVTKLARGRYPRSINPPEDLVYAPWVELSQLQSNLSGFTVVFAELLTGKRIYDDDEFQKIDDLLMQHGKTSLVDVAQSCFRICNEVHSESKMLRILKEYEHCIPLCRSEEFATAATESYIP
ncbi:serine/threonine-protein kinase PCRK2 [Lactuca sativa]|uniref:serine/threonine-protein kinase PCRK2 n=1 Tax=Lactuca sativa TaxID=4236 RepID=UPI000CD98DD8|nr:serine/threonine-protein kinase PCRK2 [Lactuca sativa]XP_042752518.1 serine/threonine-protein kinase PCRK2 [Lactuca sativa]